jgi:penicillin-binding protein 1A
MTGGSLPAQTWHEIMAYAHQGVELKNITGIGPNGVSVGPILENNKNEALRPVMLTNKGVQALLRVERLMDEAGRAIVATPPAPVAPAATTTPTPTPPKRAGNKVGSVAAASN